MDEKTLSIEDVLEQYGELVYTVKGISMLPIIRQRKDVIIIQKQQSYDFQERDVLLFKRDNGEYVVHRVIKKKKCEYGMCGDNQSFIEWIRADQILGIVDSVTRNGYTIPLRLSPRHPNFAPWYRAYLFLWCDLFAFRSLVVRIEYKLRAISKR